MTALDPVFTIGSQMVETLKIHSKMSRKDARTVAIDTLADVAIPRPAERGGAPHGVGYWERPTTMFT